MKFSSIIIFIAIILFDSCKQKDSTTNDTSKPIFTIVEPTDGDTTELSIEPEIHIEFTVTDNVGLSSLNVQLMDASSNVLGNWSPAVSNLKVYPFHQHVVPSGISSVSMLKAKLMATDLAGNLESKEITFYVAP